MFLVCSFICVIFLCLFITFFFNLLCLRYSFPRLQVGFFLPFGFCPPKVCLVVCVSFISGEICAEFLFVGLFVFPLMDKVVILSADDWVCIFFVCCLDEASCTGCYWWLGDAGSCIQVVSFV